MGSTLTNYRVDCEVETKRADDRKFRSRSLGNNVTRYKTLNQKESRQRLGVTPDMSRIAIWDVELIIHFAIVLSKRRSVYITLSLVHSRLFILNEPLRFEGLKPDKLYLVIE